MVAGICDRREWLRVVVAMDGRFLASLGMTRVLPGITK